MHYFALIPRRENPYIGYIQVLNYCFRLDVVLESKVFKEGISLLIAI